MLKVLVVDDELSNIDLLSTLIQRTCKASVRTATSVHEALQTIEKTDFDLIVCDYQMPQDDGAKMYQEMSSRKIPSYFLLWTQALQKDVPELSGPFYLGSIKKSESKVVCSIIKNIESQKNPPNSL